SWATARATSTLTTTPAAGWTRTTCPSRAATTSRPTAASRRASAAAWTSCAGARVRSALAGEAVRPPEARSPPDRWLLPLAEGVLGHLPAAPETRPRGRQRLRRWGRWLLERRQGSLDLHPLAQLLQQLLAFQPAQPEEQERVTVELLTQQVVDRRD